MITSTIPAITINFDNTIPTIITEPGILQAAQIHWLLLTGVQKR